MESKRVAYVDGVKLWVKEEYDKGKTPYWIFKQVQTEKLKCVGESIIINMLRDIIPDIPTSQMDKIVKSCEEKFHEGVLRQWGLK